MLELHSFADLTQSLHLNLDDLRKTLKKPLLPILLMQSHADPIETPSFLDGYHVVYLAVASRYCADGSEEASDGYVYIQGAGDDSDITGRVSQIKTEIENTDSDYDREKLQERLAKLSGGVAVIKVGAATEVELKEKKHRIEDAVSTTKAAVEEGVVPGGGVALLRAQAAILDIAEKLEGDEATGARIVARAVEEPLKQIAVNAGLEGGVVVERVRNLTTPSEGLNAATGEFVDLVKAGVIDPAKVTRSALQNAASIAGLLLTTEAIIADIPEKKEAPAGGGHGGGMDGMY